MSRIDEDAFTTNCLILRMEDENTTITEETFSGQSAEFILLSITGILSLLCTLVILSFLLRHWRELIVKALRNHFALLLVVVTLIYLTMDFPFTINYYRLGYDEPHSLLFCLWWYWIDYSLVITSIFLTATASLQRHVLIFDAHWLHQRRRRWLLHFVPLSICLFYPAAFYLAVIFLHSCDYSEHEESHYCFTPCYTENRVLFNLDWVLNTASPLVAIILANIALIIRVVRSMRRTRQRHALTWRRQRKLALQLFALSSLFVIGWAPSTVVSILQSFALPTLSDDVPQLEYLNYLTYFVCPLQPFICFFGIPELTKGLKAFVKQIFRRPRVTPVRTIGLAMNH